MPDLGNGITVVALPRAVPAAVTAPAAPSPIAVLPVPGPPGPPGGGTGSGAQIHQQTTPTATWTVTHTFGRLPAVDLYIAGVLVEADVEATTTSVTVTFPTPTAGYAVLV